MTCHLTLFVACFSVNFNMFYKQKRGVWNNCLWFRSIFFSSYHSCFNWLLPKLQLQQHHQICHLQLQVRMRWLLNWDVPATRYLTPVVSHLPQPSPSGRLRSGGLPSSQVWSLVVSPTTLLVDLQRRLRECGVAKKVITSVVVVIWMRRWWCEGEEDVVGGSVMERRSEQIDGSEDDVGWGWRVRWWGRRQRMTVVVRRMDDKGGQWWWKGQRWWGEIERRQRRWGCGILQNYPLFYGWNG